MAGQTPYTMLLFRSASLLFQMIPQTRSNWSKWPILLSTEPSVKAETAFAPTARFPKKSAGVRYHREWIDIATLRLLSACETAAVFRARLFVRLITNRPAPQSGNHQS